MKKTTLLIIISLLCILLMGCNGAKNIDKEDLIFIVGNTYGSPLVDYSYFSSSIFETYQNGGSISFIQMDSKPSLVDTVEIPLDELKGKSKTNQKKTIELYTKGTVAALCEIVPDHAGVDVVASFLEASKNISPDSKVRIICVSNLLSTENSLVDLSKGVDSLSESTNKILSELEAEHNIPKFTNVTIECYEMGKITSQEMDLTNKELHALCGFYEEFFNAAGCNDISFKTDTLPQNTTLVIPEEYRYFPTIPVMYNSIEVENNHINEINEGDIVNFDETVLEFIPDSAEFSNKNDAISILLNFVEPINNTIAKGEKIALIGTTAQTSKSPYGDKELSLKRCESVKRLLLELGVNDKDAILTYGIGFHESICVKNINSLGEFNEEIAQSNRAVRLLLSTEPLVELAKTL